MRFQYVFPGRTVPPVTALLSAQALTEQAVAAERAGFAAVGMDDHPAPPHAWRMTPSGHDGLDPFLTLAAVAAATREIRLCTFLAVLPYRNPFQFARLVATLDVLSGGRVMLGLGAGYLPGEFAALGVSWEDRNAIFDESLEVARAAWTGEPVTWSGPRFGTTEPVTIAPRPLQLPHPPLWFGGNSTRALRRVVQHGEGWMTLPASRTAEFSRHSPALQDTADLELLLGRLRREQELAGRTRPVEILHSLVPTPAGPEEWLDALGRLAEVGVTWVSVGSTARTPAEAVEEIERFGREVIACS